AGTPSRPCVGDATATFTEGSASRSPQNSLRLDQLQLDRDMNLFAHQDSAGLQRGVPGQAKVLAVNLRRGFEANTSIPPRILARLRRPFHLERDGLSDSMNCQVAGHRVLRLVLLLHIRGLKRDRRILLRIQKVRTLQVRIALGLTGVERVDV